MLKCDILLTYTPSDKEINRICGHTFQVMDYYLYFKDLGLNVKILIQDKIKKELIYEVWEDKYLLNKLNYNYKPDILFYSFKEIYAKNIIYTNGIYPSDLDYINNKRNKIFYKNIISFRCDPKINYSFFLKRKNYYLLYDKRLYKDSKEIFNHPNSINYIKKINFKYFKDLKQSNSSKKSKYLIYVNSFLRNSLNEKDLKEILLKKDSSEILFVSSTSLSKEQIKFYKEFGELKYAPVKNLFNQFDTFIYTPNIRNFDCSPRLLTECKFYNKEIIINFDIKKDIGAYWRWYDIQNNFESLELKEGDDIEKFIIIQKTILFAN